MRSLFIGMISGTSADGIDTVLVDFAPTHHTKKLTVVAQQTFGYDESLRNEVLLLSQPSNQAASQRLDQLGHLEHQVGKAFAQAAQDICHKADVPLDTVTAIGSHGQTLRHRPTGNAPFTLQIGDPNVIAYQTGITTVADFRRMDIAAGGQGAPLVPLFHQWLYSDAESNRVILNLGGIANLTLLPKDGSPVMGFDTGPANAFLDYWISKHQNRPFDEQGQWAAQGQVDQALLEQLLQDDYFAAPVPKSTGREYFNSQWLESKLKNFSYLSPENIQATLVELTAVTISMHFKHLSAPCESLVICGGGAHNQFLTARLAHYLDGNTAFTSPGHQGVHADFVEASAFAWLAKKRIENCRLDFTSVTGAESPLLYGNIFSS